MTNFRTIPPSMKDGLPPVPFASTLRRFLTVSTGRYWISFLNTGDLVKIFVIGFPHFLRGP
ncbi:uncharacterized protein PHALS_00310 [Plasmopara halstedii]|uniref:Uncharacterized protein n=1 Tax=Plasmopara halstedii TaxID=4781 RepID=A0A0P1A749_PLAHL|nr:uncharacterized protein PHALS_00310 [Plasmopara halstedii]CEG35988.1 hypothetical protein PHALS_00310 [Plasmopara halstedii]|eukprot:XP_024572357.1 hypothetical protein PHALS_00310 [Plasmopara halstedii]